MIETRREGPVSYTHLDVYKRQDDCRYAAQIKRQGARKKALREAKNEKEKMCIRDSTDCPHYLLGWVREPGMALEPAPERRSNMNTQTHRTCIRMSQEEYDLLKEKSRADVYKRQLYTCAHGRS